MNANARPLVTEPSAFDVDTTTAKRWHPPSMQVSHFLKMFLDTRQGLFWNTGDLYMNNVPRFFQAPTQKTSDSSVIIIEA